MPSFQDIGDDAGRRVDFIVTPGFRLLALAGPLALLAAIGRHDAGTAYDVRVLSGAGGLIDSAEGVQVHTVREGEGDGIVFVVGVDQAAAADAMRATLALVAQDLDAETVNRITATLGLRAALSDGGGQEPSAVAMRSCSRRIRNVMAYAKEHLDEPLSIDQLASVACLSSRQFVRVFHRETGQTPARLVEAMRAEAARTLIEDGSETIERIAVLVGFADSERMRRAFVRRFSRSPQELRRQARRPRP